MHRLTLLNIEVDVLMQICLWYLYVPILHVFIEKILI